MASGTARPENERIGKIAHSYTQLNVVRSRCGVKFTAHKKWFPTAFAVTSAKVIPFAAVYLHFVVRRSHIMTRVSLVKCAVCVFVPLCWRESSSTIFGRLNFGGKLYVLALRSPNQDPRIRFLSARSNPSTT